MAISCNSMGAECGKPTGTSNCGFRYIVKLLRGRLLCPTANVGCELNEYQQYSDLGQEIRQVQLQLRRDR